MKFLLYLIIVCYLCGCASGECRGETCQSYKRTAAFCNEVQAEGAFCLEYDYFNYCVREGLNKQKIATMCMDTLVYKEILDVFDGKWAKGTVGNSQPTEDSTGAGPYWIDRIEYGYSSFTTDFVQGKRLYHHYCKSKDNKKCDMIFLIHTSRGPMYIYNYETKEIKSDGWPM